MNYDIIVIGAGTSAGFLLAFLDEQAATRKAKVLLLEKTRAPFRKIYASGNGRCNFSNADITESSYYSVAAPESWRKIAFAQAARLDLRNYFFDRGIPSRADEFGRLMPYTNSAKTIGGYFERYLNSGNVTLSNYSEVTDVVKKDGGFAVRYARDKQALSARADIVVYACGGSAYPQLGTDGSSFELLRKLGHTVTRQAPGIVPLETKEKAFHALAGLKMECRITVGGFSRKGELLFTNYGISGPNVLYASNTAALALAGGPVKMTVDFLPEEAFSLNYFKSVHARSVEKTISATFGGVLSAEFLDAFTRHNGLRDALAPGEVERVRACFKEVVFTVTGTRPYKEAQVSLGGVTAGEIDPVSFESKLQQGLFIMGEAIDYTGQCGGYNIHWCAATAHGVAGALAARRDR